MAEVWGSASGIVKRHAANPFDNHPQLMVMVRVMKNILAPVLVAVLWMSTPAPLSHPADMSQFVDDGAVLVAVAKQAPVRQPKGHTPKSAQALARLKVSRSGWHEGRQWQCLVTLWQRESGWRYKANNPTSSAQGIPQLLNLPPDLSPAEQIDRGIKYIKHRYGTPCKALQSSFDRGWY